MATEELIGEREGATRRRRSNKTSRLARAVGDDVMARSMPMQPCNKKNGKGVWGKGRQVSCHVCLCGSRSVVARAQVWGTKYMLNNKV